MGHKTIFLKEIYQGFQIRHQKILKIIFYVRHLFLDLEFPKSISPQKNLPIFFKKPNIVLYNIVQNLRCLFMFSYNINFSNLFQGRLYKLRT